MILLLLLALPAAAAPAAPRLASSFEAPLGGPGVSAGAQAALTAPAPAPAMIAPSLSDDRLTAPSVRLAPAAASPVALQSVSAVPAALQAVRPAAAVDPKVPPKAIAALRALDKVIPEGKPADVTPEFQSLWDGPPGSKLRAEEHPELERLRDYKVLLVPGFMTGLYVRLGNRADWPARRYFGDQLDWLKKQGIEHEVVDVHSLQSVEHNAPIIAKSIQGSEKPVLVVTHSMGGRILLHALITRPELRARVRGWTPMQTPFLGSHVADLPAVVGVSRLLAFLGGTFETVRAMTGRRSRRYYHVNREAIEEVLRAVPVVAFASWVNTEAPAWLSLANPALKWAWNAVSRRGGKNDILVPVDNAALPGMPLVVMPGVDHVSAVVDTPATVDRTRILKTLLTMVLKRSPGAP